MEELKRLYAAKLRQVSQHAQRSQRGLQLQLFKAQQEKNRLQEELNRLRREKGEESGASPKQTSPSLEEMQWKVTVLGGQKDRRIQRVKNVSTLAGLPKVGGNLAAEAAAEGLAGRGDPEAERALPAEDAAQGDAHRAA